MAQTGIIGHRGAAGLALENSLDSLTAALQHNIDAIEFDVRRTKDGKLVVMHDSHTGRIAKQKVLVSRQTLAQMQTLQLKNGQHIPSLDDVCKQISSKIPMVIDIKDARSSNEILRVIAAYPHACISFTSLRYRELERLHKARPDLPIFVRDALNPFEVIHSAVRLHAEGISLNKWLMNPLTYWLAKRRNLEIRVYTVNNRRLGKLLQKIYPGIVLYTNHPERFAS